MTIAYITCKDRKEAETISMRLLRKKYIACANIFPIKSMFWWNGKIEKSREFAIIAKSSDGNFDRLMKEVIRIHSYKIPCILKISAEANGSFDKWVNGVLDDK